MTAVCRRTLDKQGFFDWLERQDRRYELAGGVPVMLPNVTRNHRRVCMNVIALLLGQLDHSAFEVSHGGFAVETGPGSIRYADVMVEPAGGPGSARSTDQALLLVEVLSPSSIGTDFNDKLAEYQALSACDAYLILDQDAPRAWLWVRSGGEWPAQPDIRSGMQARIELQRLGCALPFEEIYFGVQFQT